MKSRVRDAREVVLNRLSGIALAASIEGDTTTVQACMYSRLALLNITTDESVLAAQNDEQLTQAFMAAHMAIKETAPENVRAAFRDFRV